MLFRSLEGCPQSWEEANSWIEKANSNKEKGKEPIWSFDCGFKLDFDGPIFSVSSRFYPPKEFYGPTWDGTVTIYFLGNEIQERSFNCQSLDVLKKEVEKHIEFFASILKSKL